MTSVSRNGKILVSENFQNMLGMVKWSVSFRTCYKIEVIDRDVLSMKKEESLYALYSRKMWKIYDLALLCLPQDPRSIAIYRGIYRLDLSGNIKFLMRLL